MLEHLFLPRLNREFFANFDMLTQINLAHLLMLRERGILDLSLIHIYRVDDGHAQPLADHAADGGGVGRFDR